MLSSDPLWQAAEEMVASKGKDNMSLGERKALAAISGYAEPPGTGNVDFAVDVPAMLKEDGSTAYVSSVENMDGRLVLTLSTGARVDVSEVSFQNADAAVYTFFNSSGPPL